MKKRRLLSMLLTLAMTVSSLPMTMATSVSAADAASENLADDVVAVTDATPKDETEDGYLSIGGRSNRNHALQYAYNFKYGTRYKITFDARQSVPSNSGLSIRVRGNQPGTDEFSAWGVKNAFEAAKTSEAVQSMTGNWHWIHSENTGATGVSAKNQAENDAWAELLESGDAVYETNAAAKDAIGAAVAADETVIAAAEAAGNGAKEALLAENAEATEEEQKAAYDEAYAASVAEAKEAAVAAYKADHNGRLSFEDYKNYGDNVAMATLPANGTWVSSSMEFEFAENADAETVLDVIAMYAGTSGVYVQAFDIDNFVLYEQVDGDWTELESYDFDVAGETPIATGADSVEGYFKLGNYYLTSGTAGNSKLINTVTGDTEYYRVAAGGEEATVAEITFDDNTKLVPGRYEISADLRQGYSVATEAYDSSVDVATAVKVNGKEVASIDTNVKNVWTEIEPISFILTKETEISDITVEATSLDTVTYTVNNNAVTEYAGLDVKSVELYCIEEYNVSEVIESDDLLDGATATYTGDVTYKTATDSNGYMSVEPRQWKAGTYNAPSGIFKLTLTEKYVAERTYYISFDMRLSAESNYALAARVLSGAYNAAKTNWVMPIDEKCTISIVDKTGNTRRISVSDTEWKHFEGSFIPLYSDSNGTSSIGETTAMSFTIQRGYGDEIQPVDFDNIKVWYMDGETEVEVYKNGFDSVLQAEKGTLAKADSSADIIYVKNEDFNAIECLGNSPAGVTYTDIDEEVTNGVYKLTTALRVPYYSYSTEAYNSTNKVTAKGLNMVNHRTADIVVELSDGTTEVIEQEYNVIFDPIATEICLENGATIESIKISTDVTGDFIPETVDVADLEFKVSLTKVKDIVAEPAIPADPEDDTAILYNIEDEFGGELIDSDDIASFRKGNKYVTLSGTKNNSNSYFINLSNVIDESKLDSETKYYLSIDVRSSVKSSMNPQWRISPNGTKQYNTAVTHYGTNVDRGYMSNYDSSSEWTTLVREYKAGTAHQYQCGINTYAVYPIDIDNIKVYAEGEEDSPIYLNDFNNINVGTVAYGGNVLSGCGIYGYSNSNVKSSKNNVLNTYEDTLNAFRVTTKLEVVQEEPYREITVVNGKNAAVDPVSNDIDEPIDAGVYKLTADLRNTKFYHDNKTPALAEVFTLDTNGKTILDTIKGDVPYNIVKTGADGKATEADIYDLSDLNETFTYTNLDNNGHLSANGYNYSSTFSAVTYVNNNYFNIKAVATTSGDPVESNTVKVDNTWTDAEFTFNIPEDTTLKSIKFVVDSPVEGKNVMSGKTLTLGMKDVDFSYVGEIVDEAVEAAIKAINDIGEVAYTDECLAKIEAAEEACKDLTEAQIEKVTNYAELAAAKAQYNNLKTEAENAAKIQDVIDLIDAIDAIEYTPECLAKIVAAEEAYAALDDALKGGVTNYGNLTNARNAYDELANALPDTVKAFIEAVENLGEITLASGEAINAAKSLYEEIPEAERSKAADAKAELDTAEANYNALVAADTQAAADAKAFDDAVAAIDDVTLEDEAAIIAARAQYTNLSEAAKAKVTALATLEAAEEALAQLKQEAADKAAADAVVALIEALPAVDELTLDNKADVVAARTAYGKLTDAQKDLVNNLATLEAAETKIFALENVPEEGQILSNIEDDFAGAALVDENAIKSFDEGNKYLTIYGRKNNWDGIWLTFDTAKFGETYNADNKYLISIDVRSSVYTSITTYWRNNDGVALDKNGNITKSGVTMANYNSTDDWTTALLEFKPSSLEKYVLIAGTTNAYQAYAYDVDNIKVYNANDPTDVVYSIDFQDASMGMTNADFAAYGITHRYNARTDYATFAAANPNHVLTLNPELLEASRSDHQFCIGIDEPYYNVALATGGAAIVDPVYTDRLDTELEAGTYTLSASLRNVVFNASAQAATTYDTPESTDLSTLNEKFLYYYPNSGKYYNNIYVNNNYFVVKAVLTTDNGTEIESTNTVTVKDNWINTKFTFNLTEAVALDNIKLVVENPMEGKDGTLTLGMKNVDFYLFVDEKVEAVRELIDALPDAENVTLATKNAIEAARTAYDALDDEQKAMVDITKLTAAENALAVLLAQEEAAAKAFDDAVAAIGDVTLEDEAAIIAARTQYTKLSDVAKAKVTALATLEAAEATLATLKQEAADKKAAADVDALIEGLPAVDALTLDNKADVVAARTAYGKLTDAQKALVTNLATLEAAEAQIEKLEDVPAEGQILSNIERKFGGSYIDENVIESWTEGNKYLTVYNNKNNWDGYWIKIPASEVEDKMDDGKTYYLSLDTRASVYVLPAFTPRWRAAGTKTDINTNSDRNVMSRYDAAAWTTLKFNYTKGMNYQLLLDSRINGVFPFDVDNIKIYAEGEEPIYRINFENLDVGASTADLANVYIFPHSQKTAQDAGDNPTLNDYPEIKDAARGDTQLTVSADEGYYNVVLANGTAAITDPTYTVKAGTKLVPGEYTITASLRNTFFYADPDVSAEPETPTAGSDGNPYDISDLTDKFIYYFKDTNNQIIPGTEDKYKSTFSAQVYVNNNYYNVKAVVTTADGLTLESKPVKVTNVWEDLEFSFDIFEETELKSVTFVVDSPVEGKAVMDGKTLTLGMRDIDLVKTADIETPDITSDVGVKVVIDKESVNEGGTITAKLYAISRTYPVDITSLTFTLDVPEYLTIKSFTTKIDEDAAAINPETGAFAWFYDIYSEREYYTIDGELLIAEVQLEVGEDGINENKTATIGLKADSNDTPCNYTVLGEVGDETYKGHVLDSISDTVVVNNLLTVKTVDPEVGATVEEVNLAVAEGTKITVADKTITIGDKVITAVIDEHYEFLGWKNGEADLADGEYTVDADFVISAEIKAVDYTVTKAPEVSGADTANNGVDYTFTVTADGEYTVFVKIGDADKAAYNAVGGTYTIAGTDIVADIEITVEYAVYRTVEVVAGDDKVEFDELSFNVLDGEKLSADDVAAIESAITAAEYTAGYELDGYKVKDGDAYVDADLNAVVTADTTIYVFTKAIEYTFTVPAGMTATVDGEAVTGETATVYVDSVIELTPAESATTIVLDATVDGVSIKNGDGKYIVPASAIMSETEVETVTVTYKLITDDVYKALKAETQILVIEGTLGETGYAFGGEALFFDSKLGGYATVITDADAATSITIAAKLTKTAVKATEIAHTGDVNRDGKINSTDALYVSTMLHTPANKNIDTRMRLEANNHGDEPVVTTTDAAWILVQWING